MKPPLLCFYGDDFTGSTDALEWLSRAGLRTVLFLEPPTADQLARCNYPDAIGVAGTSRSMSPAAMKLALTSAFNQLKSLGPRHVHYKVCSTFDSSPTVGSIGCAIDIAWGVFHPQLIPLLVGAPVLGRHCAFGNLFARFGSEGDPVRLDRHPSMSNHPVTPADESDLRLHLSRQTQKTVSLFNLLKVALPFADAKSALNELLAAHPQVILFDAVYQEQLLNIGRLIDSCVESSKPLFSVGSSGIEMALADHWVAEGKFQRKNSWPNPGVAEPLLVVSGSCSPVTEKQIATAIASGFAEVALDTVSLARQPSSSSAVERAATAAIAYLKSGRNCIVHCSRGNSDSRLAPTRAALDKLFGGDALAAGTISAKIFGAALGEIIRHALTQIKLHRVCIAGGDTSGYVGRALGIESMEMIAPLAPGAPLCRANAPGSPADGLELNFKGGQVGPSEYFIQVAIGL